jgi:ankyrin repeat protein
MLGAENGHYDVVKLLYSVVEFSPLEAAMGRSGVKRLCDPSARDLQGKTAILLAAEKGLNKIVSLLLSLKVSYLDTDHSGDTLLHVLARVGNLDIARVVVGLEVVAFSNNAAARRRGKLSEYPQRKRYLVLKNAERYTPADLARQSKHLDLERFLLKAAGDLYGTEFAKSSGANTFDTDENQKEYDAADSLDYDFAIVVPKLLAQGFSPQGYYSMIPKVVDDGSDSDASE